MLRVSITIQEKEMKNKSERRRQRSRETISYIKEKHRVGWTQKRTRERDPQTQVMNAAEQRSHYSAMLSVSDFRRRRRRSLTTLQTKYLDILRFLHIKA